MTHGTVLELVSAPESPVADVVFVHGLAGDARQTWSSDASNEFWPAMLSTDLTEIAVYTLGYPASVLGKPVKREMDLFERATNVLELFAGYQIGDRPIVFVAHSLGGILVKMIIRKSTESADADWQRVADSTRLVFFIATPHDGSELANLGRFIPNTSKHVALLANKAGWLEDLNEHYRSFANGREDITTVAYYEKHATSAGVIVSRDSADPGVAGAPPIPVDKDHFNICKPSDTEDMVYMSVKRHIRRLLQSADSSDHVAVGLTLAEDYDEKSDEDRRDLHQKLLDAGREHEYGYANNAQNGFARRYTSTGLLTSAREDHSNLLSEVETRFVTHVYHPLICQSASNEEINDALQDRIFNELAGKQIGHTTFDAKSVLSALYFLTERCYIRWDVPK